MAELQAMAERHIAASPQAVYECLADYGKRHGEILPTAYHDYHSEQVGSTADTTVSWVLHVGRHRRPYAMKVQRDPVNHRLLEQDSNSSFRSEWQVSADADGCRVVLRSSWTQRSHGFPAMFERLFAPRSLARLHAKTLQRLADAIDRAGATPG